MVPLVQLLTTVDASTSDVSGLQDKLDRKKKVKHPRHTGKHSTASYTGYNEDDSEPCSLEMILSLNR